MELEIRQRWREYERLSGLGEHYSALLHVADVYSCLDRLPHHLRTEFGKRFDSIQLASDVLQSVEVGITKAQQRITKILGTGTTWNDDEFLLLITLQVQTDLLRSLLNARTVKPRSAAHEQCLSAIKRAGESKENHEAYQQAVSLARQNWGLPVPHELFG